MIKRIFVFALCCATMSSCLIGHSLNLFRRSDIVCSEHHKRLKPVIVLVDYGFAGHTNSTYGPPYLKRHYSGGCVVRLQRFSVMYHCPKCEREHRRDQKAQKTKNAAHF